MKRRKDGRYATTLTIDGIKHFIYGTTINEVNEKKAQLIQGTKVYKCLFKDVCEMWFETTKSNLQYNTQKMYRLNLKYLEPLYKKPINKLKTQDIMPIFEDFLQKPRTYNMILLTLNQIFEFAIDEDFCTKNIVRKIKPLKKLKVEKKPLTFEQIKLIEYSLDLEPRLLISYFLICTGLRREELIPLRYEDIDGDVIHINKAVYFEHNQPVIKTTKNELSRDVPLLENLKNKLPPGSGLIFPNEKGNMMSETTYKRKIAFCSKYLGIPFTGHQLRHTYATMLYNSNVPIKEAQYFLGHKDIRILLNIYTHLDDEKKKQSISKINDFLSKE